MHLRNVLLPDPDGPMMQRTSPFGTLTLMPLRTSSVPNRFRTSAATTSGASGERFCVSMSFTSSLVVADRGDAFREIFLDAALDETENGDDREIPDRCYDQQFDH